MTTGERDRLATLLEMHGELEEFLKFGHEAVIDSLNLLHSLEMQIFRLCEVVNNHSRGFKAVHEEIDWHTFRFTRNILAHSYFRDGYEKAWEIATISIPAVIAQLNEIARVEKKQAAPYLANSSASGVTRLLEVFAKAGSIKEVAGRYGLVNVAVFGSVARGEDSKKSDVDFLVDLKPGKNLLSAPYMVRESDVVLRSPVINSFTKAAHRDQIYI
jgi:uncharacterized protein